MCSGTSALTLQLTVTQFFIILSKDGAIQQVLSAQRKIVLAKCNLYTDKSRSHFVQSLPSLYV